MKTQGSFLRRLWSLRRIYSANSHLSLSAAFNAEAVIIHIPHEHFVTVLSLRWRSLYDEDPRREMSAPVHNRLEFFFVPCSAEAMDLPTRKTKIYAQHLASQSAIAIYQVVYSSVEIFVNHWSDIRQQGLSSPYVLVIPYAFMSLVNLLANTMVPVYPQVTVLEPLPDSSTGDLVSIRSGADEMGVSIYGLSFPCSSNDSLTSFNR